MWQILIVLGFCVYFARNITKGVFRLRVYSKNIGSHRFDCRFLYCFLSKINLHWWCESSHWIKNHIFVKITAHWECFFAKFFLTLWCYQIGSGHIRKRSALFHNGELRQLIGIVGILRGALPLVRYMYQSYNPRGASCFSLPTISGSRRPTIRVRTIRLTPFFLCLINPHFNHSVES